MRIGLLALAGWIVAAGLTVGLSWSAISVVEEAVAPAASVAAGLPSPEEPAPTTRRPTPTGTAPTGTTPTGTAPTGTAPTGTAPTRTAPRPTAVNRAGTGTGGTAVFQCRDGRAVAVNAVPRQGYEVEQNGSEVEFRSGDHRTELTATCAGGVPRVAVEEKDEGGGGSGRGRGGNDD